MGNRHVSDFSELEAYKAARGLARDIFVRTQQFPREETYSLTDQVRRSVRSIGAQIAEVWGKRAYERHFVSKLTDADAERRETQHWVLVAYDCGYLSREEARALYQRLAEVGMMLWGMIGKSHEFCSASPNAVREDEAPYTVCEFPEP
jgi:four helix bundle protein